MLDGKTIWLTRPDGQSNPLTDALAAAGANVRSLPMLVIEPLPEDTAIRARVMDLDAYDQLFFISTNAAGLGMALIDKYWPQFPVQLDIYAVGPTTAAVVESYGLRVTCPEARMSSEALLALPALAHIDGKRALIVRGVGGRELLAGELAGRGARVDYLELYRRARPDLAPGALKALLDSDKPDAIVVTSAEALGNLQDYLAADNVPVETIPLFVSSPRLAEIAVNAGFVRTRTMPGADDKAIIDTLTGIP